VTGERLPGGRFEPDGDVHGCATHRLAEVVPQLPQARREDYWPVTGAELAEWQRRWEQANTPAAVARHNRREMRRLLPRRTLLRLWRDQRIDGVAAWLLDHGRDRAAITLWRVTGLWSA
jgi:hypothetical protein